MRRATVSSILIVLVTVAAALIPGAALAAKLHARTAAASLSSGILLGDQTVESTVDSNDPGQAEAFPFVAGSSGSAPVMELYVDGESTASTVSVGVYSDNNGQPGSLLAQGSASSPTLAAWNLIALDSAVTITAGDTYWITVLGTGGTVYFRDSESGSCSSNTSAETDLTALPQTWNRGTSWPTCSISAYAIASTVVTPPPPPPSAPSNLTAPAVSGTAVQGNPLTTTDGTWANGPTGYTYQWQDCDASGQNCSNIAGATSNSYQLTSADVGDTVVSVVTATNAGGSTPQASSATAVVTAPSSTGGSTTPSTPSNLTAGAPDSTAAQLSWTAVGDPSAISAYAVYRDGVQIATTTSTSYSDTAVTANTSYQYSVSAIGSGGTQSSQTVAITVITPAAGAKTIFSDNFTGNALSSAWTVISRHGEYAQSETECNTPQQVSVSGNMLDISTIAQDTSCGDFNLDGSVRHAPTVWPYATGDVQWTSFNFTYGTVSYRAKFPPQNTVTWPAIWLLGSNCQATNIVTADVGYSTCPALGSPGYTEIDMTECDTENWCQIALAQPSSFPVCGYPVDSGWHTFTMTWTPLAITEYVDGNPTGCSYASSDGYVIPSTPMFLIVQTQTGGVGGTPQDANLPANLDVSDVTVSR